MGFQENLNSLVQAINNRAKLSDIEPIGDLIANSSSHVPLSGVTSYHLLSGSLALANSVITNGFATTLYTGNGTTQSVVTGVDMATQWGNDSSETYGGLVWIKSRIQGSTGYIGNNHLFDTVRGVNNMVWSDLTGAQQTDAQSITAFNNNGFTVGTRVAINTNTHGFASWIFQTTHRITGTTNHGKAYTCHYNPFTGFTIVKYEGSGRAGHEIPHHLGRKLGFFTIKNLSATENWYAQWKDGSYLELNTTLADTSFAGPNVTENAVSINVRNTSTQQYIMYGWANSYYDETNTLIGNYEIGIYQGTGAAGNKVTTRGKPAWVMVKRLDSTSDWVVMDNMRGSFDSSLYPNTSSVEGTGNDFFDIVSDGMVTKTPTLYNASGGQYLYMVVYDNDSGSGKSKYPRATDTSTLNLNATIPFANGIDANGVKNSILTKNETVSGLTFTEGKNYVYSKNDGTYGVTPHAPQYGSYNGFGDYYDVNKNKWYQSPSVFSDTMDTTANWTASNATLSIQAGKLKVTNTSENFGMAYKLLTLTAGKKYRVFHDIDVGDSAAARLGIETILGARDVKESSVNTGGVNMYFDFVAPQTSLYLNFFNQNYLSGKYVSLDNVSIYPINNDGSVDTSSATPITESRNYLNAIVYADAGGQPTYVEQLPKTEYKDIVKANEYQGKNACTAWVNFDGTTTPPTIRDSYNVKAVIRTATGVFDVYFEKPMDNSNYTMTTSGRNGNYISYNPDGSNINKVVVGTYQVTGTPAPINDTRTFVQIFGGKN